MLRGVREVPVEKVLKFGSAESVGMDTGRIKKVCDFVDKAVSEGAFPGAVVLVARKGVIATHKVYGKAVAIPPEKARPMELNTIFDLGSLTKPVATATSTMMLLERGKLRLDDPVNLFIPSFAGGEKEKVTIRDLLTHTSGLPAWKPLYKECKTRDDFLRELCQMELEYHPEEKVVYSCLGFILLTFILEKITGENLASFSSREIFKPLDMKDTFFNPPESLRDRIVATERCSWRNRVLIGEVHDENAYGMGGVSGNAGLFSTAHDVAVYAQMMLNEGKYGGVRVLSSSSVRLMTRNCTSKLNEPRGLGWLLKSEKASSAGDLFSSASFGHTGFPGTCLWIDPEKELIAILFTNRIHPTRENEAILRIRPLFHNLVASAIKD